MRMLGRGATKGESLATERCVGVLDRSVPSCFDPKMVIQFKLREGHLSPDSTSYVASPDRRSKFVEGSMREQRSYYETYDPPNTIATRE